MNQKELRFLVDLGVGKKVEDWLFEKLGQVRDKAVEFLKNDKKVAEEIEKGIKEVRKGKEK